MSLKGPLVCRNQKTIKIRRSTLKKAVSGVIKFTSENPKLKNQLFNETFSLHLQINSVKVPKFYQKILKIPLAHSVLTPDSEVCLIVSERKGIGNKEHEKHLEYYEDLLRKKGVNNVKKIMTFHEFRTEYETFELKRRLVDLYDVFLVDGKISGKVVKVAGKIFYNKHKVPIAVKLQSTKLKEHIDKTLTKIPLYLHSKGDSFSVQFGHNKMPQEALVDNILSITEALENEFPGGHSNVRSLNVYAFRGLRIPIYVNMSYEARRSNVPSQELIKFKPSTSNDDTSWLEEIRGFRD